MELFDLKYTEEIYNLSLQIQSILDHYLIDHTKINPSDIFDLIKENINIIDCGVEESDEELSDTE